MTPFLRPPRAAAAAALLALSGCGGLAGLSAVTETAALYDLSPKTSFDADLPRVRRQVVVEEPTAWSYVDTDRVAVKVGPYRVEYFPAVRWVDRAPKMVQRLLVESLENSGALAAVGRQAVGLNSDYTLIADLREFEAVSVGGADEPVGVLVRLNVKVVAEPRGLIIASESFAARTRAASNGFDDVAEAFDQALGKVLRRAVEWSVRAIAADAAG
ncbi:ABC-type transport auxiliary lipoprotein family protein [Oceanicella actignis]|uniref:ABC-type transport auxiliary lipoprotein family protein n=1 Tax=Oceanicella actignis TaxID=1189325 RepID=UPI0011E8494C|nr:ABC-type transport auxiliary lipoprotein family protein [Oceanicella actignis]TYO91233.1 cholesterol transport system auxiliary component [Oceanicella actignis]